MSRLDEAKRWYESQRATLEAIHEWMRTRPEVPKPLQPLLRDYYDKKKGPEHFKVVREDLQRTALIRLFSGFEVDFRSAFSGWLKSSLDRVHSAHALLRLEPAIGKALPESVRACMDLFRALEPRLSASDVGWFHALRDYRNIVMHQGFPDAPAKEDPLQAHANLRRILDALTT